MAKRLENKNIVVTAAGQGIGRAVAIAFNKQGAKVIATDLNEKTLASLNKEYKDIETQKLDSTDYKAIKLFADKIKKIDVLFNAVGFVHHGTILECDEKDWDFSFNTNIKSMYFMIKSIIPKMIEQKKGNIINVSSIVSSLRGLPNRFVYGSSKAAIIGLTKSLGKELADKNIAVNAVTPSSANTRILNQMSEKHVKFMLSKVPRGRFLELNEFSSLISWLSSEENSFSTAAVFDISGGRSTY